ncbi:hypothetical protein COCC4DRAFT_194843 [Bipolaris maydis ATCC 48331]|uniref:Biotrophy-associated secreted protein 2 n=2 Tax=Cochliobolus heterostrophus TaxID=5016 RepID=M2TWI3_COCH5|nr:uncharacterized protein COCC4DRAFT_194843 [Bipolaris maydis ATCC 48331]EMD90854.1 hypothetical protein COCHEDRAFT_1176339 [Bipolaris maydis C5]KAH7560001.1 hypothetical protein BM1_03635 [Bipolaris maydis]ENI06060.1 hypothetical protein COCC4DRAFT_194843 [Bipolaris maydis ATCC 48331]KAJ5022603.1 hypothetical protein J3E73DRAFT_384839 [Bipolaris maydis]KAJ5064727.1 hypothetical protein J3E74DRAFT_415717 [Bipolaris maydis]
MAPIFKLLTILSLTLYTSAQGTQFITGACTSDAACASGCCGFKSGKCAAPIVANEQGQGCGFGDAQPNNNALNGGNKAMGDTAPQPQAPASGQSMVGEEAAPAPAPAPAASAAPQAKGTQFITGACTSDADCASACCGFKSGKCAGPVVAQERDGGCGFGDAQPNDDAARALQGRSLGRRGPGFM